MEGGACERAERKGGGHAVPRSSDHAGIGLWKTRRWRGLCPVRDRRRPVRGQAREERPVIQPPRVRRAGSPRPITSCGRSARLRARAPREAPSRPVSRFLGLRRGAASAWTASGGPRTWARISSRPNDWTSRRATSADYAGSRRQSAQSRMRDAGPVVLSQRTLVGLAPEVRRVDRRGLAVRRGGVTENSALGPRWSQGCSPPSAPDPALEGRDPPIERGKRGRLRLAGVLVAERVESSVDCVESSVDCLESSVDCVESSVDCLESSVDCLE